MKISQILFWSISSKYLTDSILGSYLFFLSFIIISYELYFWIFGWIFLCIVPLTKWYLKHRKVQIHLMVIIYFPKNTFSCFNDYFLILSSFLNMPKKAKGKSINMTKKWKQWYIKTDSKLLICWLFPNALLLDLLSISL